MTKLPSFFFFFLTFRFLVTFAISKILSKTFREEPFSKTSNPTFQPLNTINQSITRRSVNPKRSTSSEQRNRDGRREYQGGGSADYWNVPSSSQIGSLRPRLHSLAILLVISRSRFSSSISLSRLLTQKNACRLILFYNCYIGFISEPIQCCYTFFCSWAILMKQLCCCCPFTLALLLLFFHIVCLIIC